MTVAQLRERLAREVFAEDEVSGASHTPDEIARELGYRRGWNHAIGHVRRLLQELEAGVVP